MAVRVPAQDCRHSGQVALASGAVQRAGCPAPNLFGKDEMTQEARETVTITRSEHDRLLADRDLLTALQAILVPLTEGLAKRSPGAVIGVTRISPNPGYGGVSPIDRDPELASFIRPLLGKSTVQVISDLCRERFGPDRAPSKSAIHRFWQRSNGLKRWLKSP